MASRLIVIRQRLAAALDAAFAAFTGEVSPVLDERVGPFLDDEDVDFDFAALQRALARMVTASRDRLVDADKTHINELAGDGAARRERDRRVKAVRDKLIEIRGILGGLFGAERTRAIVAVDGATAEQPELLWRQAEHTVSRLRDPELRLPAATTRAVHLDPAQFADELEPDVKALRLAIDAVAIDVQEAALTVEVKKVAMAEHDRLMSACGRILSGLYLLADRPDLARQVRVTPPRVRTAKKAGETPAPTRMQEEASDDRAADVRRSGDPVGEASKRRDHAAVPKQRAPGEPGRSSLRLVDDPELLPPQLPPEPGFDLGPSLSTSPNPGSTGGMIVEGACNGSSC